MKGGSHVLRYFSDSAGGFGHCGSAEKSTTKVAKQPQLSEGEGAGAKAPAHPGYAQPEFCSCPDDYSVGWPLTTLAFRACVIWLIPSQLYDLWQKFNVSRGVLFACAVALIVIEFGLALLP